MEEEVRKHFFEYQSVLCEMTKAEQERNAKFETLNNRLNGARDSYERGSEEDKFRQFLHAATEEHYALAAAFSKQLREECEKRGLHPIPLQMLKDLVNNSVKAFREEERIRQKHALIRAYNENILLFYRHSAEILCNPLWYHAAIPVCIYGISDTITIGMMVGLWQKDDEYFVTHDGRDESLVTNFSGSPLSGSTWLKLVSLRTGKTIVTHSGGFLARVKRLAEIIKATSKPDDCTPVRLVDLVQILKDREA